MGIVVIGEAVLLSVVRWGASSNPDGHHPPVPADELVQGLLAWAGILAIPLVGAASLVYFVRRTWASALAAFLVVGTAAGTFLLALLEQASRGDSYDDA